MPRRSARFPLTPALLSPRYALFLASVLAFAGVPSWAVSCTTQGAMQPAERDGLVAAATPMASSIAVQNFDQLQSALLPAVLGDWEGIKGVAQGAAPLFKGGAVQWRNVYLLDASDQKAPADTIFFCTNADTTITVTINLRNLPPGRYGLLIGDATGTPLAGQLGLIVGADSSAGGAWKLGGIFVREGALDGHDAVWYWTRARELATKKAAWSAWFSYDAARWLELPVDFISSPNLEKLNKEQSIAGTNPVDSLPLTVASSAADPGNATKWRITGLRLDTSLHTADLGMTYEGTGVTDPVAAKAEATAVMSALLKLHPELRESFHGLWAYAEKDGKQTSANELAMHDIP